MTKRAVVYARVSTDEQANNYSLSTQLEACRKYAIGLGMEIVAEMSDDFTGAVPIELRPEGKKAFQMLSTGQADVLVVYRVDRLVRPPEDGDEWDTPVLLRRLAKTKKEIHTCDRGQLKTDFASLLIATLDARSAGEERRKIVERTSRGKLAKARSGKVVGNGPPPYGYVNVNGSLIVVEKEAAVVREIFRMYVESGMTIYEIANELTLRGIEIPLAKHRCVNSTVWARSTIFRILRSRVYRGEWVYGLRSSSGVQHNIVVNVTPIVPVEDWDRAAAIADYNAMIASRNRHATYLLSGMVRCTCGFSMCVKKMPTSYVYFCTSHMSRQAKARGHECHQSQIPGQVLEDRVWKYIKSMLSGDFESELRAAQEAEREAAGAGRDQIDAMNTMLQDLERQAANLAAAIRSASGLVLSTLEAESAKLSAQYRDLKARRDALMASAEAIALSDKRIESLLEFRDRVLRGLDRATREDKRKYFEILQLKVTVKGNEIQIATVIESRAS